MAKHDKNLAFELYFFSSKVLQIGCCKVAKFWCTWAKTVVLGSKVRVFGFLGVKIEESDTHL